MNLQTILDGIQQFMAAAHIDEHTLLIFAGGVIVGLIFAGGHHRRAAGYVRRYASRYRPW